MSRVQSQSQWCPECVICKESVKLEESKADEYGQAAHEECYVSKLTEKTAEPT
jgi:organic hydroperoxide reductase OsmC/OhrA